MLNLYREEHPDDTDLPENRPLVRDLADLSDGGPVLTLPEAELDRFMAQWRKSNERVARELLGEPDGELFTAERRASGTTTEQRLDPDRVGHFLGALDQLPDRLEAPLLAIAEREAAR